MTAGITSITPQNASIDVDGATLFIEHATITDDDAARLVSAAPPAERLQVLSRMVAVGARGLTTMGIGVDLADIDSRVRSIVDAATSEAETTVRAILEEGRQSLDEHLDPERRSSIIARALSDFSEWRDEFLGRLDPSVEDSSTRALLDRLGALVGPDGSLQDRLREALDPDADGSAFARLTTTIEDGFSRLRLDMARESGAAAGRSAEAERGTAHGFAFEDMVERHLAAWAASRGGITVERTSVQGGTLGEAKVGDFVVTLADGSKIVVEAKRHGRIGLTGTGGILTELDRAMANRDAQVSVCVAGRDAFPAEVGTFNVYGNRILVVDEGEGTMILVALRWAEAALRTTATDRAGRDQAAVADRIDRIRKSAESLSGARRTVTSLRGSLEKLHEGLGNLRSDLLDQVGDLERLMAGDPESLGGDTAHS